MAQNQTPDQLWAATTSAMPSPLGALHYHLYQEVAWLHLRWNDFRDIFAGSPETIELCKKTAPSFFANLHKGLWESTLLHICRLTDKSIVAGKETLTLLRLPEDIPDHTLRSEVDFLIETVKKKVEFARSWRNRRIAHTELPPLAGEPIRPLANANRQRVEDALESFRNVMNAIELHYLKSRTYYSDAIPQSGGVGSLLVYLTKGLEADRRERALLLGQKSKPDN